MNPLRIASRMENMLGWFAASVLTATMVIYALRRGERPARPKLQLVDPSPAQEPIDLQLARAAEPGRGPQGEDAGPYPVAGLEGHSVPHLQRNPQRPAHGGRR